MMVHGILNGDLELVLLKQSPNWSSLVSSRVHDRKRTTLSDSHNYFIYFLVDFLMFLFFLFIYKFHLLLDFLYVRYIFNFLNLCFIFVQRNIFQFFLQMQLIHAFGLVHVRFILYSCNLRFNNNKEKKETGNGISSFLFSPKKYFSIFFVYKSFFYVLFYVFHLLYFPSVNSRT